MARETQGSPAGEKKLEQYGVWVKVKPREVAESLESESSFELSDLESPKSAAVGSAGPDESALTDDEEKLLNELESELGPEEGSAEVGVPDEEPLLAEEEELPDIETVSGEADIPTFEDAEIEELPELEEARPARAVNPARGQKTSRAPDTGEVEVTLSEETLEDERFDDLEALESELASVSSSSVKASSSSAEILAKIEDELRSIRKDLTELRGELSGLRKGAGAPAGEAPAVGAEAQSGFFDEDEDETIALTGDELDNILNTADITEEAAEALPVESDLDALGLVEELKEEAGPGRDSLTFDTPVLEEDTLVSAVEDLDTDATVTPTDDLMTFDEDVLLPEEESAGDESETATLEELPPELVLDELGTEPLSPQPAPAEDVEELPGLDMEEIAEIEMEAPEVGAPRDTIDAGGERSDETIDLETLDLGEEPTVIEAMPENLDDLETIADAEEVVVEDEDSGGITSGPDEVDLESLAAEAEALEDDDTVAPAEDLEIGELESVSEDEPIADTSEKEIEIAFESEPDVLSEPFSEPADQILEAEEVLDEQPGAVPSSSDSGMGIPDNLKDEIRTVLKYMDHLLEALPDEKIQEFASSDYFVMYKKLFEDLGLGE